MIMPVVVSVVMVAHVYRETAVGVISGQYQVRGDFHKKHLWSHYLMLLLMLKYVLLTV